MSRAAAVSALALVTIAAACSHAPTHGSEDAAPWFELTTPSLRIQTDLPLAEARRFSQLLEVQWRALSISAWPEAQRRSPLQEVVLLRDWSLAVGQGSHLDGQFVIPEFHPPFILTHGQANFENRTLAHELAHALAYDVGLSHAAPLWFVEGLACLLEAVEYDSRAGVVLYGEGNRKLYQIAESERLLEFETLWHEPIPADRARFYATSWLLVHYLFNHRASELAEFQRALIDKEPARKAWNRLFPDLIGLAVKPMLWQFMNTGTFRKVRLPMQEPSFDITVRPIFSGHVHALRALVFATSQPRKVDARMLAAAEVEKALRKDPSDLLANTLARLLLGQGRSDVAGAERLVSLHPGEGAAWAILAASHQELGHVDQAARALAQARSLGFPDPDAQAMRTLPPLRAP